MKELPHPTDIAVGQAIRQRRLLAEMSQGALGERIGVSFQQIQKYERGTNRVSASMLVEIARALKTDVRRFFDEVTQNDNIATDDAVRNMTRETVILARAFGQIENTRLRHKILELVKAAALLEEEDTPDSTQEAAE
jgi:transcriptional regulator with XRE-family HTH domain